jgi:16S rRNA (uracil1498-N3)-methyltransferase
VSAPRFLAAEIDPARDEIELPADESHHLARVLRLSGGDEVVVFDGRGSEYRARVVRADHRRASVRIVEPLPPSPAPRVPVVLVQSVLKGDKMDSVVRDATMAGVVRIAPVVTGRSQIALPSLERAHARDRWQRVAVSSAKQCRRSRLPVIDAPQPFEAWLAEPFDGLKLLLAEPEAADASVVSLRAALAGAVPPAVACVVGPEGGWPVEERRAAVSAGCIPVSLGTATLRADAVGLVAVSMISFAYQET